MLLSLICLVHLNRDILPKGRPILYAQCVDLLIDAWQRSKGFLISPSQISASQKETVLRHIAYELQKSGKGELRRSELEILVEEIRARLAIDTSARELIEDIEIRSGLLVERSIDVLGFSHLTLQEYLAARHFQLVVELQPELLLNAFNPAWAEVVLLYVGLIENGSSLIEYIAKDPSHAEFAAHCIGEAQTVDETIVARIIDQLLNSLESTDPATDRDHLINALASLASDYRDGQTMSKRQELSQKLISCMLGTESTSAPAAAILGRARVTRALPILVEAWLTRQELRPNCVRALVLFGNLALDRTSIA